jgi:transposase
MRCSGCGSTAVSERPERTAQGTAGFVAVSSRPLVEELKVYLRAQLDQFSPGDDLAKAINYILKRWAAFRLFLEDGRVCLSNNAAERGLRGVAQGRKCWLFAGPIAVGSVRR